MMDHRLQNSYTLSVRPSGKRGQQQKSELSYEDSIQRIGTFSTVEEFWRIYSHMPRPGNDTLGRGMDFHLFKDGIKVCDTVHIFLWLSSRLRCGQRTLALVSFMRASIGAGTMAE